MTDWKL